MHQSGMARQFGLIVAMMAIVTPSVFPAVAVAQDYPNRPIRLIVPYPPGGTTDALGRVFAQALQERIGQPVVVDNRAGAGSQIGVESGARAQPDGYTLLFGPSDGLAILPALKTRLPYDPHKDFTPIALLARSPLVFASGMHVPVKTLPEFVALAKAKPGALRFGSAGIGSIQHVAMELLRVSTGIELVHVPYKGGGPALTDLIGGQIDLVDPGPVGIAKRGEAGQLRVLAQTGPQRHPLLPNAPTTTELGMPEVLVVSWFGLLGPPGLPQSVVERLIKDTSAVLEQPALVQRFVDVGCEVSLLGPAAFAEFIAAEIRKWTRIVDAAKIPKQD